MHGRLYPVRQLCGSVATIKCETGRIGLDLDRLDGRVRAQRWCQGCYERQAALDTSATSEGLPPSDQGLGAAAANLSRAGGGSATHGVPRSTTALTKINNFLAQATSATLCGFPFAIR